MGTSSTIDTTFESNITDWQAFFNSKAGKSVTIGENIDVPLGTTLTIPSTVDLAAFVDGSMFTGQGTVIIGRMSARPTQQIFDTDLSVTLPGDANAAWFGAVGDGVTNDTPAILAVNAAIEGSSFAVLDSATYLLGTTTSDTILRLRFSTGTVLKWLGFSPTINCDILDSNNHFDCSIADVPTMLNDTLRAKWFSSDIAKTVAALPSIGGVVVLDSVAFSDDHYAAPVYPGITKNNVTIIGPTKPIIDFSNGLISGNCAYIDGTVRVDADNFCSEKVVYYTGTEELEGDCLAIPTAGRSGGKISDCAFVGYNRSSSAHCLLIERHGDIEVRDVQTYNNKWGVVFKASRCTLMGLKAYNHNEGPFITKSDTDYTYTDITVDGIEYGSDGPTYYGSLYIQCYNAGSYLRRVNVSNVIMRNAGIYISNVNDAETNGLEDINLSNITLYGGVSPAINGIEFRTRPCNGVVNLSNIILSGSFVTGFVNPCFTNVYLSGTNSIPSVSGQYKSRNRPSDIIVKTGVVNDAVTEIFKATTDLATIMCLDIAIAMTSTSAGACARWLYTQVYNVSTFSNAQITGYLLEAFELTASINTSTMVTTFSLRQKNTNGDTGSLRICVEPKIARNIIEVEPL